MSKKNEVGFIIKEDLLQIGKKKLKYHTGPWDGPYSKGEEGIPMDNRKIPSGLIVVNGIVGADYS